MGSLSIRMKSLFSPHMGEADLRKEIQDLRGQIEALRDALASVSRPYTEIASYLERFQGLFQSYLRLLDLYQRHGAVSPDLVVPGLKDDISRHIVTVLIERGTATFPRLRRP